MVVKMMRWRPWPPLVTKKYEVRLVVRRMEGWDLVREGAAGEERLTVEIRWKGPKVALSTLRRTVKRNFTREVEVDAGQHNNDDDDNVNKNGVVLWDEEFYSLCTLSAYITKKMSFIHGRSLSLSSMFTLQRALGIHLHYLLTWGFAKIRERFDRLRQCFEECLECGGWQIA